MNGQQGETALQPSRHVPVVVVGGGLAGLSATLEAARYFQDSGAELNVLLIEKQPSLGGNSAKASSGINALNEVAGDTHALFEGDTVNSGRGLSKVELVEKLVDHSSEALAFLASLGANLSRVGRLGGHSVPRTRSNSVGPNVGFALIKAASDAVAQLPNVTVLTGAKVQQLSRGPSGRILIRFTVAPTSKLPQQWQQSPSASGDELVEADALILATGGFAASRALLEQYAPSVASLATTNGPWADGSGLQLGSDLGGSLLQLDQVQVHPTGLVDPADPEAGTKWLAPERLRGCGGVLLHPETGVRFVDELATRDVVTAAVMGLPRKRCWLLLGPASAEEYGVKTLEFYASRSLFTLVHGVEAAAQHMGVPAQQLQEGLAAYDAAAAAAETNGTTNGEPGVAITPSKRIYPHPVGAGAPVAPLWLALVTPVVHYCMGGLEINAAASVLGSDGQPLRGLWAAGEVSGGLHGANRLGGNSLAECVVFGRIAGRQAAQYAETAAAVVDKAAAAVVDSVVGATSPAL